MPTRARVALIRTAPPTVLQDYERLLGLVECRKWLDPSATTILQASTSQHFPFPSANTTPWQLEGAARALRAAGYADLVWVQPQPTIANPFKGTDLDGYAPILHAYGIPMSDRERRWVRYEPRGPMLVLDRLWQRGIEIPERFVGTNIVYLPTLRIDRAIRMAGAMWGTIGGLLERRRYVPRRWVYALLVDLLTIQREIHSGILAVVDGTTIGQGPRGRTPEVKNVILASADPVAIDAVAGGLMGFDPLRDLAYVRLAHERGLGCGDIREIELVGDTDLARESWQPGASDRSAERLGTLIEAGPLELLRRLAGGSTTLGRLLDKLARYDAYYRWPAQSRRVFESWLRGTHWGQLFQRYQKPGQFGLSSPPQLVEWP